MSDLLLPHAAHLTEFYKGETGTCGQTALAVCEGCVLGGDATEDLMEAITNEMRAKKLCAPNGAATLAALAQEARNRGFLTPIEWDYSEPLTGHDMRATLNASAGHMPFVVQVARAYNLHDSETGTADESGVHYHAWAVVGKRAEDVFICVDPDSTEVTRRYQIYRWDTIASAVPCGLLGLQMPTPKPDPTLPTIKLAAGWTGTATNLVGPPVAAVGAQRFPVTGDFARALIAHPELFDALGAPIEAEHSVANVGDDNQHGPGVVQFFTMGALARTVKEGVFRLWVGLMYLRK